MGKIRFTAGLITLFALVAVGFPQPATGTEMAGAARLEAQRRIEAVYHARRIWPADNPAPKPSLEQRLSTTALMERAERGPKMSAALQELWGEEITPAMLQAEMARMAVNTRDPEMLRELFAALDHDPAKIAEMIARPILAERLLRSRFATDPRFQAEAREAAAALLSGVRLGVPPAGNAERLKITRRATGTGQSIDSMTGAPRLDDEPAGLAGAALGDVFNQEDMDEFRLLRVVAVSAEVIEYSVERVAKAGFSQWWQEQSANFSVNESRTAAPASTFSHTLPDIESIESGGNCETWSKIKGNPPDARQGHVSVWTGTEMIVWGGYAGSVYFFNGGRYNPATDSWQSMATLLSPAARAGHAAVWSGTEMIIWGGYAGATYFASGGRYNPATDTWAATAATGAPTARTLPTAVWNGSRMVVWGGTNTGAFLASGGRYDPAANSWSATTTTSAPEGRYFHTAIWSGSRMVVWGGYNASGNLSTGGRYDPAADVWTAVSTGANLPAARRLHTAVWSGTRMVVWGGSGAGGYRSDGARYDPAGDAWSSLTATGTAAARSRHSAVWSGTEMIVWGGTGSGGYLNTGGRYNPSTDVWAATGSGAGLPSARHSHSAIWSGSQMIVWGGHDGVSEIATGGRLTPGTGVWQSTPPPAGPTGRSSHSAVWTGAEMIIWGGEGSGGAATRTSSGSRYNPATDSWSPTSTGANLPAARAQHSAIWTGTQMVVWGGLDVTNTSCCAINSGGLYDPAADSWSTVTTTSAPGVRYLHTAVWSGTEMLVWGGQNFGTGYLGSGGRYNPATNSWQSTTATGAPAARTLHTAVWSGTEMIVWGGRAALYQGDGGRYNPGANSWTAIPADAASPTARIGHAAVWSGTEMIVWGGANATPVYNNTGGRYNPATSAWTAVTTTAAPAARSQASGVWTGSELLVWGGTDGTRQVSGGRFSPRTNSWSTTTTTAAPTARFLHTAVWNSATRRMLVWGGNDGTATDSGASLALNTLAQPATFTATANGNNRIDLAWSAVATATAYHVYRSLSATGPFTELTIVNAPTLTYSDTTVSGTATYYYFVRAYLTCESAESVVASAATTGACTLAPVYGGLSAVQSAGMASCTNTLTWSAATPYCGGPVSYRIYRSTNPAFFPDGTNRIALGVTGTSYRDSAALASGTVYYYIVRAFDDSNSATDGNNIRQSGAPLGPLNNTLFLDTFEGAQSGGGFDNAGWTHSALTGTLDWDWNTSYAQSPTHAWHAGFAGSIGSRVLIGPDQAITGQTQLSFRHTYYTESGFDGGRVDVSTNGGSSWSALPTAAYLQGTPTCTIGSLPGGPVWCGGTLGSMTEVRADLSAYAGQSVRLRWIAAEDSSVGTTGWFVDDVRLITPSACATCSAAPPGTPTGLTANATGGNQITINWTNGVPAAAAFNIYRAPGTCASATAYNLVAAGVTGAGYVDNSAVGGALGAVTYAYKITGADAAVTCESALSACVEASPCNIPPPFTGANYAINAAGSNCSVNLAWFSTSGQCGTSAVTYSVYRSTDPAFIPAPANRIAAGLSTTSYSDMIGLTENTRYYYVVRASDTIGNTDTNLARQTTMPTGPYGPATGTFTETFEGAQSGGGFDNPGWFRKTLTGTGAWSWSTAQSQTPTHSWFSSPQATAGSRALQGPDLQTTATSQISFHHTFDFAGCADGGVLEYGFGTTNDNWYAVVSADFSAGVYNGTIVNGNFSNPYYGRSAFCNGTLGAMTQAMIPATNLATGRLRLRWAEGDDSATASNGWYVDSVTVTNVLLPSACVNCAAAPPGVPTALDAFTTGATQISMTWTAGAPAGTTYSVYRSLTFSGTYTRIASGVAATTYVDNSVTPGITYYYKVAGAGADGCESALSAYDYAASCATAPSFAGLQTAVSGYTSTCMAILNWNSGSDLCATGSLVYDVYRGATPGFTPTPANRIATGITALTLTDVAGLAPGSDYFYLVRARDGYGNTNMNVNYRAVAPTGALTAGTATFTDNFEGALGGGGFDAPGWNHAPGIGATDWAWSTAQAQSPTHSWFAASQATAGDRYLTSPPLAIISNSVLSFQHTFGYAGCDDGGVVEYTSDGVNWYIFYGSYFATGGYNGTISGSGNPLNGREAFCGGTIAAMTPVTANLGVTFGAQDTFRLRWRQGDSSATAGTGWYVDSVSVTNVRQPAACTLCSGTPAVAPTNLVVTNTAANQMTLTWNPSVPAATSYGVFRSAGSGGPYTQVAAGVTATTWVDNSALAGTNYYRVSAVTDPGCESIPGAYNSAYNCTSLPSFSGLISTTTQSGCAITLDWAAATAYCGPIPSTNFNIYRSTASGFIPSAANRIASNQPGLSYTDGTGGLSGTTYYYVVRAVDNFGFEETNTTRRSALPVNTIAAAYYDSFEGALSGGGFDLAGWTRVVLAGTLNLDWNTSRSQSPTHSWHSGAEFNGSRALISPAFTIPANGLLNFYHTHQMQNGFDGGRLDYSTDGGAIWTPIPEANYLAGAPTCTIAVLPGGLAWCGGSLGTLTPVTVSLSTWVGQSVQFRWIAAENGSTNQAGWYIDSVSIGTFNCPTCAGTVPGVPTGLAVTNSAASQMTLTWNASIPAATSYSVFRSGSGNGPFVQVATGVTATTWVDSSPLAGTNYYRVSGLSSPGCESSPGAYVSASNCTSLPSFSGLISATTQSGCAISLEWNTGTANCSPSTTTNYNIYRSTVSNFTPATTNRIATGQTALSYTDTTGGLSGTTYYYVVRAVDSFGYEETNTTRRSALPVNTIAATYYDSFEGALSGGGFDLAGWTHTILTGTLDWDWNVTQSQSPTHSWHSGAAFNSSRALISPAFTIPANGLLNFYHTYQMQTGFDGGRLDYSTDGGAIWTPIPLANYMAGAPTCTIAVLPGGLAWCGGTVGALTPVTVSLSTWTGQSLKFRWIAAENGSTNQAGWFVDSVSIGTFNCPVCSGTVPGVPSGLAITNTAANQLTVTWSPGAPPATSSNVYRSLNSTGPFVLAASGITAASWIDTSPLGANANNHYKVAGLGGAGCESIPSTSNFVYNCTSVPSFSGLTSAAGAVASGCVINLVWSSGSAPCGGNSTPTYNIYRSTTPGFAPSAANRIARGYSGTSYSDVIGVTSGTTYYYIVRAMDNFGVEETNVIQRSATPGGSISPTITDTFEGALSGGGFDLAGWTHSVVTGVFDWEWDATQSQTPTHSWHARNESNGRRILVSPAFIIPATGLLSFYHTYNTEAGYDGGRVEFSTDGGAIWTPIPIGNYLAGAPTCTISALPGGQVWCGGSIGPMTAVTISLSTWVGQSVMFRWIAAEDGSVNGAGWYVDTVVIGTTVACNSCALTPMSVLTHAKSGTDLVENWGAVGGASAYKVFRTTRPDPFSWGATAGSTGAGITTWSDVGQLSLPGSLFYTVTVTNSCGAESPQQ